MKISINGRPVGDGAPSYIVAEVGQAHDGSYALAHAYIDAVADAGADAVKMQLHLADQECEPLEPWRAVPCWKQDASRYDYWKRMEFTPQQWAEMRDHAHVRGLGFIVSPFSVAAVRMLGPIVDAWKVASGEVQNEPLLEAIKADGKPVIVSHGMSDERLSPGSFDLTCVSLYPCPPEYIECPDGQSRRDGISDHSGTIWPAIVYAAMGWGGIIEVHVTLARGTGLLDETSSITIEELKQLVEGVRFVERMGKAMLAERELALEPMRQLFMGKWKRKAAYDAERVATIQREVGS